MSDARRPESLERLSALLEHERPDELVLAEADFDEETVLGVVQLAHRHGVKVKLAPTTTELLVHEGEYVPGEGVPLFELRPPLLSGVAWATKRVFDLVVGSAARRRRHAALALARGRPSSSTRVGPSSTSTGGSACGEREFGMLKFRTMVADAADLQQELESENEASGRAVQDPGRPARDARRRGAAASLARRASAARERAPRRDEPRRPAAAPASRPRDARRLAQGALPRAARA